MTPAARDPGPPAAAIRLVQIVTSPLTAFNLLRGQLAFLGSAGFEVIVVTSPEPAELVRRVVRREGVAVYGVPMAREIRPLADLVALVRLYRLLRRLRPAIVNASTPKAALLGLVAARAAGVPRRCYTLRGLRLETARGLKRAVLVLAERAVHRSAHRVVAVSQSLRRRYLELGFSGDKVRVLGPGSSNGVDPERFAAAGGPSPSDLRRELEIPAGAPVVGFVGRLTRDKGIADLAACLEASAGGHLGDAHLVLLGDFEAGDPLPPELRRRLLAHPRVRHLSFVTDPAPYYRLFDLLALPSYREGFPNAVLEAAAAGVPTVGYRVTGTLDAVEHGETGLLVEPGDVAGLAAACGRYLEAPELRREHGERAQRRAADCFRGELVWRRWADFFLELSRS